MSKYSLVVVSNRLPINIVRTETGLEYEVSSGGLATAMSSLEHDNRIWIGWPGIASDDLTKQEQAEITEELEKRGFYPVFLTAAEIHMYYEGYANDTIWPLFHYFQSLARYKDQYWKAYQIADKRFADAVKACAKSDALVWIHDYHLMLLPEQVRTVLPTVSIGFFLHIPFPSFEIFRLLPERKEILRGLLGADVVGFHIYDYGRHFLSSCMRLLGLPSSGGIIHHDGRQIKVGSYPIGIDYVKFQKELSKKDTKKAIASLSKTYEKQRLIISVDRLDYSKGIPERLDAFRMLLEQHPEYIGNVKLLMVAVPSRTNVEAYQQLRDHIEKTVSRINGTYSTVDWAPISYQFQNRPFTEVVALYARADVALVTPLRDGMNLVAKEYVASKRRQPGVLILSEMTGAIDEMPEALSINPNNTQSISNAMHRALNMPKRDQIKRLETMQRRLKIASVQNWGAEFVTDLEIAAGQHDQMLRKRMSASERQRIMTASHEASSRLIVLDYDGTLKSLIRTPTTIAATPSLRLRWIIRRLSELPNTTVAVVSGRPRKALARWFIGLDVVLAAEHGAWTRYEKKWKHVETNFKQYKKQIKPILDRYVSRTAGSEIEEKDYSLVWHYVNVTPELAYGRASDLKRELESLLKDQDVGVFEGNKIIEIKPHDVSKAHVAEELKSRFPAEFVFCAGDDYTDEDMFKVLDDIATTIKVGSGETRARYQLEDVSQMLSLLDDLSKQDKTSILDIKLSLPRR